MSKHPRWMVDTKAFEDHFSLSKADFDLVLSVLPPDLLARYERTGSHHPEAAILWTIHQGRQLGLITGSFDARPTPSSDTEETD